MFFLYVCTEPFLWIKYEGQLCFVPKSVSPLLAGVAFNVCRIFVLFYSADSHSRLMHKIHQSVPRENLWACCFTSNYWLVFTLWCLPLFSVAFHLTFFTFMIKPLTHLRSFLHSWSKPYNYNSIRHIRRILRAKIENSAGLAHCVDQSETRSNKASQSEHQTVQLFDMFTRWQHISNGVKVLSSPRQTF